MNSIKGYQYELWCLARAAGVRYCVWNEDRKDKGELTYNEIIFEDLVRRFEKPDSRNRWDSTLFELQPSKDGYSNPQLTLWMMSLGNSLYELDQATQEMMNVALSGLLKVSIGQGFTRTEAKEKRLKNLVKSGNYLVKKFKKHQDQKLSHEMHVAQ
ncbi:Protein KTI12-like protein, partial [Bienertia sinuspersici]